MDNIIPAGYTDQMRKLKHDLLFSKEKKASVEDLAAIVLKSTSTLYKACSLTEDNPPPFELDWLVPFMIAKKNYKILKHISILTGHLPPVKIPPFKKSSVDENKSAIEYQKTANQAVTSLFTFINEPTKSNFDILNELLENVIKESLHNKFYCAKKLSGQFELF